MDGKSQEAIAISHERESESEMRHIKGLTKDTLKLLERIHKQSKYYQVRQRAQHGGWICSRFREHPWRGDF